jgi:exopolysaccharide/PEP-CTERM locus tyrosine autokinase
MSLVERALKKMQQSRASATAVDKAVVPAPGAPRDPPAATAAPEASRKSSRIVNVDREALRAAELLPAPAEERRLAHEYRQIKRPLIANAFGRGVPRLPRGQVMLVASALPGDGKTFTSFNLALSLALEKDVSVLLIDADVAKPHVSRIFGVVEEPGLLDVIRDQSIDVESTVMRTSIEGLEIMPAGRGSENATELLASSRMEAIVAQLVAHNPNRIVLLDSPPLLLTSESRVLCSVAGQAVLVVSADSTPRQAVFDAITLMGEGRFIGLVLNQCSVSHQAGYYNYYGQRENSGEAPAS